MKNSVKEVTTDQTTVTLANTGFGLVAVAGTCLCLVNCADTGFGVDDTSIGLVTVDDTGFGLVNDKSFGSLPVIVEAGKYLDSGRLLGLSTAGSETHVSSDSSSDNSS